VTTQLQLIIIIIIIIIISKGDLKAETESEIVVAQDQALNTKYYATKILHTEKDSKCRLCQQHHETIDHIISACPILAKEQYVKRHEKFSAQIHFNICKEIGMQLDKKTLVRTCTKLSSNKSRREGDYIVESASAN